MIASQRLLERRQLEATDGVSSLAALPGAFERSIKPFDDFADELARAFGDGRVSARVSAAGLGEENFVVVKSVTSLCGC